MIAPPNQSDIDLPEEEPVLAPVQKPLPEQLWTRLSWILAGATTLTLVFLFWIYFNPQAPINPYPPVSIPPTVVLPTATSTPTATMTPRPSATATATSTPTATATPQPTVTPFPTDTLSPSELLTQAKVGTSTATSSPVTGYSYTVQDGNPVAISSSIMRPESDCKWMGVAGQVIGLDDAPVLGLRVQLYGSLHGRVKAITSLSGTVDRYGKAGYEITINDFPTATYRTLWLQLFSQAGGALSDKVYIETYASCDKNLIIVNFKQVK